MNNLFVKAKNSLAFKKIAANSAWILLEKGIRLIVGLLVGAWVARYLGPALFGELAYVLAFLAFFQVISVLGMDGIIVRDISKRREEAPSLLGTALTLRITSGFICWLLAIFLMGLINGWDDHSVKITALAGGTLLFQAGDTVDLWFQSQSQSKRTVLMKLIAVSISNGLKVIFIINEAPLSFFALVVSIEAMISAVCLAFAYKRFRCESSWMLDTKLIERLLKESWPFILSGLSIIIYMRIDQIMIGEILGNAELGIYAAAITLSFMWSVIPMSLSVSFAPILSKKKAQSEYDYRITLSRIFRLFSLLGWLVCIPIYFFADELVRVLYGVDYESAAFVLKIFIFTNIFINMGVAQSLWILNEGKSKISFYKTLFGALVCVTLNYFLIPVYGIIGAAISAVLSQFSSTVLINFFICRDIFLLQCKSLILLDCRDYYEK
ncbi:flippase [Vibrio breoganii]|uniref:flippase n=1 Tax=Vibrio breoganii TaxID=553239 RepID=UPI001054D968|nr:flippase [Vibrio breoganii]